jgi:hypothetical protein
MKLRYLIVLIPALAFLSCDKDSDMQPENSVLTGKIRGVEFTYGSGRCVDFGPQVDEFNIRIDNAGPMVLDSCDTNSDDVYIRVDVPKATGKGTLSEDDNIYVVFHHPDFFQNLIIYGEGYYDVKSYDTDQMEIEFDIFMNDDNNVKGTCTVYRCN